MVCFLYFIFNIDFHQIVKHEKEFCIQTDLEL